MLRNYFRVALRVLGRSPGYAAINIVGLALGLASCILMLLYVQEEWTYDRFHRNADEIYRLYRVEQRVHTPVKRSGGTMAPLGPAVEQEVPGVVAAARVTTGQIEVRTPTGDLEALNVAYADASLLAMFDFGAGANDLRQPGTLLLSESAGERLGSNAGSAVRYLRGNEEQNATVTAIIPDVPSNSSLQFDALAPIGDWPSFAESADNWDWFGMGTFVQLQAGKAPAELEAALGGIIRANYGTVIDQMIDQGWWADREDAFAILAQPLKDVHLSPDIDAFFLEVSNPTYSYILLAIALVVLLIACTNFMALAVGRSVTRAREVGTRKALGASRKQVAFQFWSEAILLSVIAAALGVALADTALPVFNRLADKSLVLSLDAGALTAILGLALLVGLVAGAYPAAILSGLRPTAVLAGGDSGRRGSVFTRVVIVFQFAAAIALITTSMIMYRQLEYVADRDLGFEAEEVLVVPLGARDVTPMEVYQRLEAESASSPAVVGISPSSSAFGGSWSRTVIVEDEVNHIVYTNYIGASFLETMGMELVAGRNLSDELETDAESAILVNEALVRSFGWENPLGQEISRWPGSRVVGVVRDFNNLSLHQEVQPMVLHMSPTLSAPHYAMVRFRTQQTGRAVADLERAWNQVAAGSPFRAEFLDQRLQRLYEAERRWQEIAGFAAFFAVVISCLGLFGVATMTVSHRRKEIGVRKVFGASSGSLVALVSRDFAVLVGLAFVLGAPAAWLFSDRWLESFAYRSDVSPLLFVVAGGVALGVAMLTVSYQAVRAARANPTQTLRYE